MFCSRRLLIWLACLALIGGSAAGAYAWWKAASNPDTRLRQGVAALQAGNTQQAEHLMWLLEAGGHKDQARLLRGHLFFQEAKPQLDANRVGGSEHLLRSCLSELNKIRDRGDLRLQALALSGQCLVYLGDYAKAENALLGVLKEDPDHIDAHRSLAALYYNQGASSLAVQQLRDVARLDENDARPHRFMGSIYKDLEQYALAIPCYEAALERRLSDNAAHEARVELAECLVKILDFERAWPMLENEPAGSADLVAVRGECLVGLGRTAEAQAALDEGLKSYPRSVILLQHRAKLYQETHQPQIAATLLESAIKINPGDYPSHFLLAQVYESLERPAQAAEQRRLSEQIKGYLVEMNQLHNEVLSDPWDADVRRRLANVSLKLGRPDEANLWLQAAAACAPINKEAGLTGPDKN
ncbi:MAG: tetratricopeptide repeat protein [Gemmataceae bacterium]